MAQSSELEILADGSGWTPPGWLGDVSLSRRASSAQDVLEFIRYAEENLDRVSVDRRPLPDDMSVRGVVLVSDAWHLARFVGAERGWSALPSTPRPDQVQRYATGPSREAFLYTDALDHLLDLKRYVRAPLRGSSRDVASAGKTSRLEAQREKNELIRTYLDLHPDQTVRQVEAGLADEGYPIPRSTISGSPAWKEHLGRRRAR